MNSQSMSAERMLPFGIHLPQQPVLILISPPFSNH
jgi:hypothetical protein